MANYILLGCPVCSKNKSRFTHTYATYRISSFETHLKVVCKTCKYTQYFVTIRGGVHSACSTGGLTENAYV